MQQQKRYQNRGGLGVTPSEILERLDKRRVELCLRERLTPREEREHDNIEQRIERFFGKKDKSEW